MDSLRRRALGMTDIDYLINRFHELFRRQEVQRRLNQLPLQEQVDQEHERPDEGDQLQ